eukprot:g5399.t1
MLIWILEYLGGMATSPDDKPGGANDTGGLFNWHPLMMTFAFPVFMTEALLVHSSFPTNILSRFIRKLIHATYHGLTMLFVALGLIAVFRSHSEKEPKALDDLYSPHSYLGITTMVLLVLQVLGGSILYIFPIFSETVKKQCKDYHTFTGLAVYFCAFATMLMGIQEKFGFTKKNSLHIHFHGNYEPLRTLPASIAPLMIILAFIVAFQLVILKEKELEVPAEGPSETTAAEQPLVHSGAEKEGIEA